MALAQEGRQAVRAGISIRLDHLRRRGWT